ncbi:Hypothetical predicted protein [Olea europaea subsp. europaea]|uniref:Membrane-associated kinase regulator 4 n=1 Tax=Olea europaea subsp. europaea TaxID=158383 RepID=A0A8S0RZZ2_OLEEU|nr:Hypothetical predicted protein [Olea europaea subsp. europaea]
MATNSSLCFSADDEEEEYIDMDLSFTYCSSYSSPQSKDFEFQMSSICNDNGTTTSSADDLFYKGQLLPLHRPPRLQMVQNLLQTSTATAAFETSKQDFKEENHHNTLFITCSTNTSSSAMESCRLSCELNPDENFFEWSAELSSFINKQHPKNSWSKKMKLIKQSILVQKLKSSRAYLKSLFSKSTCNLEAENLPKVQESSNNEYIKFTSQKSFVNIGNNNIRRRSFSGAINRHSATKYSSFSSITSSGASSSSSSSSSFNSSGFQELHFLKRSSSATEIEHSIEAAIAHCKKSQQISESRNNTSRDAAFCSI